MIRAKTAQLRARLSKYLKAVRAGQEVVIQDRDTPIARLLPMAAAAAADEEELILRPKEPGAPALGRLEILGIPHRGTDSVAVLREDRRKR
jgi:prevent-host-death family protein